MNKLKKSELVRGVASKVNGLTQKDTEATIDALAEFVIEQLQAGNAVPLPGLGYFSLSVRKAREWRNFQSKEVITIPSRTTPVFKASTSLKQAVTDVEPR